MFISKHSGPIAIRTDKLTFTSNLTTSVDLVSLKTWAAHCEPMVEYWNLVVSTDHHFTHLYGEISSQDEGLSCLQCIDIRVL